MRNCFYNACNFNDSKFFCYCAFEEIFHGAFIHFEYFTETRKRMLFNTALMVYHFLFVNIRTMTFEIYCKEIMNTWEIISNLSSLCFTKYPSNILYPQQIKKFLHCR